MVALPTLGITGGLIGNRLHLILKNDYRPYPGLTIAIVAQPGTAKTPSLKAAARPVDILQDWERAAHAKRLAEYEAELAAWKTMGKQAGEPEPVRPQMRHYFSTDLTVEALGSILAASPGSASSAMSSAAGSPQWISTRAEGLDRQQFLSLWSAQAWKIDRKRATPSISAIRGLHRRRHPDRPCRGAARCGRAPGWVRRAHPARVPMSGMADEAPRGQPRRVLALFQALDRLDHLQETPES